MAHTSGKTISKRSAGSKALARLDHIFFAVAGPMKNDLIIGKSFPATATLLPFFPIVATFAAAKGEAVGRS